MHGRSETTLSNGAKLALAALAAGIVAFVGRRSRRPGATDDARGHDDPDVHHEIIDRIGSAIVTARPDPTRGGALAVTTANPAATQLFGRAAAELEDHLLSELLGPRQDSIVQRLRGVAGGGPGFAVERIEELGTDHQRTYSLQAFPLTDGGVGIALDDVTGPTMVAAALRRQALHDGLTGLPNRTLLRDRLRVSLTEARRRNERVALILLDLDHFKEVNDTLGHQYGDRLLTAFAKRLQHLLRECDTIARLGGDEFGLLLTRATTDGARQVVQKVLDAMQEPFELDGVTLQTNASLGVAMYPDHAEDADLLTQRADVAMYTAKRGGGGWSLYSPAHDQTNIERLTLLSDLHQELDDRHPEGMTLRYQPIVDLATESVVGAEALLLWEHPHLGPLNPEMVVELAELTGLVGHLTRFVARTAARDASEWRVGGTPLTVSANLSSRNLYDRTLVDWLQTMLEETGLPPSGFRFELTESQVMDDPVLAMDVITQLHEIGVHASVDHFGTGYSSLAYLQRLPVDELKVDASFVADVASGRHAETVVRAAVDVAHDLGKQVVAEGVDRAEVVDVLEDLGCDRAQGRYLGPPMTAEGFVAFVRRRYPARP